MEHQKKLEWIHRMTRLGLEHTKFPEVQHFDSGGTALGGPTNATTGNNTQIGGVLGALSPQSGFQAQGVPIQQGTNATQLNNAYSGAQSGIQQQQGLTNALTPGVNQGANAEGTVENQLLAEGQGRGPNPAQAALNQATGQNIAQTAALEASQRGAGANAGAIASNAAAQGAATQQQAVGQGATLQAQQALAAQQEAAGIGANQINQGQTAIQGVNATQQGEQGILQNANTAANNANVTMQGNINSTNAQVAANNTNSAQNTAGGLLGGVGTALGFLGLAEGGLVKMDKGGRILDANARKHIAPENFALPGRRYPIHDINHARNALARVSQNGTPAEQKAVRAAVHKKYPSIGKAMGGVVKLAPGGLVAPQSLAASDNGPKSSVAQWLNAPTVNTAGPEILPTANIPLQQVTPLKDSLSNFKPPSKQNFTQQLTNTYNNTVQGNVGQSNVGVNDSTVNGQDAFTAGGMDTATLAAYGGKMEAKKAKDVPAMVSPGEIYLTPQQAKTVVDTGADPLKIGTRIPGQAKVKGDSLKNDTIPMTLESGGIVVDRKNAMDPDKARKFVEKTLGSKLVKRK